MTRQLAWVAFAVGCYSSSPLPPPEPPKPVPAVAAPDPSAPPEGYVEVTADRVVEMQGGDSAVLLVDQADQLVLPIVIGGTEALSIELRLRGEHARRPLTHDLLDDILQRMHASLAKVQVDELRDDVGGGGVFIGSLTLRVDKHVLHIDARPSDAIALAIGNHVPIYVARSVLVKAGISFERMGPLPPAPTGTSG
jgi:bifunctional DNase/RNase